MNRKPRRIGLTIFLALGLLVLCLTPVAPGNRPETRASSAQECIEYTVYNPQTGRCECPNQECCDFYYPFIPYGCPPKQSAKRAETRKRQSTNKN